MFKYTHSQRRTEGPDYQRGLQYPGPAQGQQQQSPLGGLQSLLPLMKSFGGAGGTGGAAATAAPAAGAASGAGAGVGAAPAAASGSGIGGAAAAAGPWAALAAVIFANEMSAKDKYRRGGKKHYQDIVTGEVAAQDLGKRWLPKLGVKEGSGTSNVLMGLHSLAMPSADIGRTLGRIKDMF